MRSRWFKRFLFLALIGLLFHAGTRPAQAHPADMYTQTYTLRLSATQATLDWTISPGPLLASSVWYEADSNGNEAIDDEEARAWVAPLLAAWESTFTSAAASAQPLTLNWEITAVSWPTDLTAFELGDTVITATLSATFPEPLGAGQWVIANPYAEAISINWFYLYGEDGVRFARPQQENGRLTILLTPDDDTALTYWDSGTPALAAGAVPVAVADGDGEVAVTAVTPAAPTTPPQDNRPYARLTALVRAQQLSPLFLLTALGISLVLGAMHGLTPGHGKALVAAYLVGSRGTPKHAAALGGIVTLTHTGSVLVVGVLTLVASRFLVPTDLFPLLEIASGLLIMAMGIGLLYQRWRGWRGVQQKRAREKADAIAAAQLPSTVHTQSTNPQPPTANRQRISIGADIPVKVYDAVLAPEAGPGMIQWRSLVGLGISGGLVPCPDAIAILLVAVAINRIMLGLSLILSFSLGLAVILIAIGLAMVQSRRLLGRFNQVERFAPAISVLSALIVLALGAALTWNTVRGAGYLTQAAVTAVAEKPSLILKQTKPAASFSLDTTHIIYVVLDEQGMYQLYSVPANGGTAVQVTQAPYGIWNYALAPNDRRVVFAALRADRGSDLWLWDSSTGEQRLLLACPEAACRNATFAPDGERIVYEKLDISPENVSGTTTLWWFDFATNETGAVFQDTSLPGFGPAWSPDGTWLSYIAPAMPTRIELYNLADGRSREFPTMTSMSVVWQPSGESLLLTDVNRATLQDGQQALTHLLRFDVSSEQLVDISQLADVSDSWPAWSADGEWVAFVRRLFTDGQPERGNQLWVMRRDGRDARRVTDAVNTLHQNVRWSPNGRFLIYHRYDLDTPLAKPAVWLLDLSTGQSREIANPGSQPAWLK
ncbi:MAG: PD40 domain-containing protein [Anaerolineales bacterium]|nr:PD40 domain-containing protein [Anaerolineales bacterium]